MSHTRALLEGLIGVVTAAFPDRFSYAGDAPIDTTGATTPLTLQFQPSDPDRCLTLYAIGMGDEANEPRGSVYVQVKARARRGLPLDCDDDLDDVMDRLHGLVGLPLAGGGAIVQCLRHVTAPMGIDDLNRRERADHYEVTVDYPPTELRPDGGAW